MTELLCNFLSYKTFRNVFLRRFLNAEQTDGVQFENIQTQYNLPGDKGRPDFAICNDELEVLFEVKTGDTYLTENQPDGYLQYLVDSDSKNRFMIFLVPDCYRYLDEWINRSSLSLAQNGKPLIKLLVIYWSDIIKDIEKSDLAEISNYFKEFLDLLKTWFELEAISFNSLEVFRMLDKSIPEILLKLYRIVDEVKNHNSKNFLVSKFINSEEYAVQFKKQDGSPMLYFGVWYDFWKDHNLPLCYGVAPSSYPNDITNTFLKSHSDSKDYEGWRMAWIDQNVLNSEDCVKKIVDLVAEELEKMSA